MQDFFLKIRYFEEYYQTGLEDLTVFFLFKPNLF